MHKLLLILALTTVPAFARTNNPELVDWAEFVSMSPTHQDQYLREVADAVAEFEVAMNQGFAEELYAANPYARPLLERVMGVVLPEARASIADGKSCDNVNFFIPAGGGDGRVCVDYGGRSPTCANPGGFLARRSTDIDDFVRKCHEKYQANPAAVTAYNQYAQSRGYAAPRGQTAASAGGQAPAIAPNAANTNAQTAGVAGDINKIEDAGRTTSSKNVGKLNKHCDAVSETDRAAARASYKAKSQAGKMPACLIGGTISKYGAGGSSMCEHRAEGCTATNTYTAAGKLGSVPRGVRTVCQSALYCTKDTKPFCVQTSAKVFDTCQTAVDKNPTKLVFGKDCVNGNVEKYKEIEASLAPICNDDNSRALLCSDCKKLKAKLDQAQSRHSPGLPASGTGSGTGSQISR